MGFSCGAQALGVWASGAVACGLSGCGSRALEHRLSGCGARAKLLCGMWDPSGPGIEPVPPALAGDFFTTEPQRSPSQLIVDKSAKTFQWKEEVFLTNDTEVNWLYTWTPTLTTYIKINSEWIIYINVRVSTLKLLEENLRVTL